MRMLQKVFDTEGKRLWDFTVIEESIYLIIAIFTIILEEILHNYINTEYNVLICIACG